MKTKLRTFLKPAAVAWLLGASLAQAAVFDDGGTHTINDATYENDTIIVENGTTLIIEPGAVLGGAGIALGQVRVFDTSTVTIHGGSFGGAGGLSGAVFARDTSTVTIYGGTFGGAGGHLDGDDPRRDLRRWPGSSCRLGHLDGDVPGLCVRYGLI